MQKVKNDTRLSPFWEGNITPRYCCCRFMATIIDSIKVNGLFYKHNVYTKKLPQFFCGNYKCSDSFLANNISTVSTYISSGTQQSTGHTAAHCGSS